MLLSLNEILCIVYQVTGGGSLLSLKSLNANLPSRFLYSFAELAANLLIPGELAEAVWLDEKSLTLAHMSILCLVVRSGIDIEGKQDLFILAEGGAGHAAFLHLF